MSGVATAIVGAAVIGAVVQKNSSDNAIASADRKATTELGFAQEQYDDWKATFGPIEDSLSTYYEDLTPDYVASQGLQALETERASALERITQSLAQRGLTGSGFDAAARTQLELSTATQKAQVRADAPSQVASEQLKFLSLGYGQNPQGQVQSVLSSQAATAETVSQAEQKAAGAAIGTAISTAGTAIADYARKSSTSGAA